MRNIYSCLITSVLLIFLFTSGFVAQGQSLPSAEREALIALYNALDGDNWNNHSGWKNAGDFSDEGTEDTWFGVTIETIGPDLAVTAIRLPNNGLSGVLPDEIGDLPFLEILDLQNNDIKGEFPSPMQNLAVLDSLNLGFNGINDTIPSWIGDLTALTFLDLSHNALVHTLPASIGNLTNLEALFLQSNALLGPVPAAFTGLTSLTDLNLSFNGLFHPNTAVLNFINNLQANWLDTQTRFPLNLTAQVISAEKIRLAWDSVAYMSDAGGYLIRYGTVANDLTDSLFIPGKDSIRVTLEDLDINTNYFFRIHSFTEPHANNTNQVISSQSGQITARTLRAIPIVEREALIALYEATDGDNWTNKTNWKDTSGQFLDRGFEQTWFGVIAPVVNDSLRVRELRLPNNNLNGTIPQKLGDLRRLFLLDLSGNELRGSIPNEVGRLKTLTRFIVNDNRLSGALPDSIGGMTSVSIFNIRGNTLRGELPPSLVNIPGNSEFDMRFNGLFSSDPALVTAINNKGNTVTWTTNQTLPPANFNVGNVQTTSANLTWTPVAFVAQPGNYQLLIGTSSGVYTDTLNMGAKNTNSFTLSNLSPGTTYFVAVQTITFAHANNKNIVRSVPTAELTFTTPALLPTAQRDALIAFYNQTGGDNWTNNSNWKKPNGQFNDPGTEGTWFGVTTELINGAAQVRELNLPNNNLVGAFPSALISFQLLKVVNLQGNRLSGNMPATINALSSLQSLNISRNRLVGAISNSLLTLNNLTSINLAFNGLFTDNEELDIFISVRDTDWKATQTVAPTSFGSQEISSTSTKITWKPIAYQANDGGYILKYGTSPSALTDSVFVNNKNVEEIILNNLQPAATYWLGAYTRTEPHAENRNRIDSELSPLFQFFALPPPPPVVTLSSPGNLNRNQPLNVLLRWEGMLGIQEYQVQVATNSNFSTGIVIDGTAPNANGFSVDGLGHNTRYFWRVRARNAGGFGPWSTVWEFRTILATPFISAPLDPTCTFAGVVNFSWQSVAGADRYILQVATGVDFTNLVIDNQNVSGTSINVANIPPNASYRWRVRAVTDAGDQSAWSPPGRIALYEQISVQGPTSFCAADGSVTLAAPPNASSYSWRRNGQIISGATTRELVVTESGNYSVQVGTGIGCVLVTDPVSITAFSIEQPSITFTGPTVRCAGESKVLTASTTAATYQWLLNDAEISGAIQSNFTATQSGAYRVRTTSAQGCTSLSEPINLRFDPLPTITAVGPTNVCQGQTAQLRASEGSSYQWFRNGIVIQGAVQRNFFASESGNYTVQVNVAGGCSATTEPSVVTVSTLPGNMITPSGAVSLCEGGTRVLTAPFGQAYQWFRNGNVIAGATAQVLEINQAGTYTVRVSNGACEVTSQPVVVSLSQPPIATITFAGATDLCFGDSRTLTSTPANGYQWLRNGVAIPGATNRNYVVTEAGNYSVELRNAAGCTTLSDEVAFTFTPLPGNTIQANGAIEFCEGSEVRLIAPLGATYQWLRNGVAIQGAQSRDLVATTSGTYRVTVTNGGICAVTSESIVVNVNPLPQALITLNGIEMQAPQGDFNYQWYKNGAPIAGATGRSYLSFSSGSYQVQLTARTGAGCSSLSPAFDFIVTDVNTPLPGQLQLKAFPNPVKDRLQLSIPKAVSNQAPLVELWSSDGRLLQQIPSIDNGSLYHAEIEMGNYRQAQYLILVRGERSTLRTWVIKH